MSRDLDSGRHGLYRKLEFCSKNQRAQVTISQLVSTGYFEVFIRGVSFIEFFYWYPITVAMEREFHRVVVRRPRAG